MSVVLILHGLCIRYIPLYILHGFISCDLIALGRVEEVNRMTAQSTLHAHSLVCPHSPNYPKVHILLLYSHSNLFTD